MWFRRLAVSVCLLASPVTTGAETVARYRLEVTYNWSAQTHPDRFPDGAHMSGLFGVTHTGRYVLFRDGQTGSSGLALMAENGRDAVLLAEWAEAMRRNRVGPSFEAPDLADLPGTVSVEFEVVPDHPYVSFVAMIAPSPDWFTGVASLPLQEADVWRDKIAVPLWAWDAGSDSGEEYDAENAETQPRQSVRLLSVPQFFGDQGLRPIGQAVLTRLE